MKEYKTKTFEDACTLKGISTQLPDVSFMPKGLGEYIVAVYMLAVIIWAINFEEEDQEWIPDYNTGDEKYFPWPDIDADDDRPAGFGFSYPYAAYVYALTSSSVGSRLLYRTRSGADYGFKQFNELYLKERIIFKD